MTCRSALAPTYNLRTKESQARDLRQGQRFHPSYFDATTKKGAAASVEPVRAPFKSDLWNVERSCHRHISTDMEDVTLFLNCRARAGRQDKVYLRVPSPYAA